MDDKKEELAYLLRKACDATNGPRKQECDWREQIYRADHPTKRQSAIYKAKVIIVGQGRKQAFINNHALTYDAQNYLVLSTPLYHLIHKLLSPLQKSHFYRWPSMLNISYDSGFDFRVRR